MWSCQQFIALAGCQLLRQVDGKSPAAAPSQDSVLLRNKDANKSLKEGEVASIKDEFIEAVKKECGKNNHIGRDDCDAITSSSQFRYSSTDKGILVYPIDNALVPVHHLDSGKCCVLETIDLGKDVSEFTYSSDGDSLTKQIELGPLKKLRVVVIISITFLAVKLS